jgi:HK97 family phage portal protein
MAFDFMFEGIKKSIGNFIKAKSYTGLFQSGNLKSKPLNWSSSDFLNAHQISLYTNRAIEKRAEKVGEVEFVARKGDKKVNHKLVDLLRNPNKIFTGSQFWALFQKYKDLTGSAYILLESEREVFRPKNITAMHLLRPDKVKPIFNDDGTLKEVKYKKFSGEEITYGEKEIIYSFRPDPLNPLEGISLLKAGARAIDTEQQIAEYHASILKNAGKVEGVFKFKTDRLTPTQLKEIKESYEKELAGARKAGRPLFLGGDAEYERLGLTPDELSYLEAKKMALNDIVILTGVPKMLLASVDDVKFANADVSLRMFLSETIRPLLTELVDVLNKKLFPDDIELGFVDPTPENKEEKRKDLETANNIHALKINEYRKALGHDPIPEGDKIYAPFNLMPLSEESPKADKSIKTKDVKSPTCRQEGESKDDCMERKIPEILEENPNMDRDEAVAIASSMCDKPCKGKGWEHPFKDYNNRRMYEKKELKRKEVSEKVFKKGIDKFLSEQKKRIVDDLEKGAGPIKTKDIIDEVFNLQAEVTLAKEALLPIIEQIFEESGQTGFDFGDVAGSFRMTPDIKSSLENRAEFFSQSFNETTFNELKNELQQSVDAGESRKQLVRRMSDKYDQISKGRANTITRTETLYAVESGKNEGYKQAGIPIKIWVTTFQNSRPHHIEADGQEVPVDQAFDVGGESLKFPGDTSLGASAGNTVNCQCSI